MNPEPASLHKKIVSFKGQLLHPSFDIKDGMIVFGFRYRANEKEEKDVFLVSDHNALHIIEDNHFQANDKTYFFEKKGRRLMPLEERWDVDEINQFVEEYNNPRVDAIPSPQKLFAEIKALIARYIELENDIDYVLLTAWILGTYFFLIFYAFPFLNPKALKGSGKSQLLNLLEKLCFNAIKARASVAALGDTVDAVRGTYLIDQSDSLTQPGNEELLNVLADSYKRSGGKRRIINLEKGKRRELLEFETYCPKAFASIKDLPEDLRDRCLIISLIKSSKNFSDPDVSDENWNESRGKLYKAAIGTHQMVTMTYGTLKINYKLTQEIVGRTLELWLPFEAMLTVFGHTDDIPSAKKRFLAQYGLSEYEPSEWEEEVIKGVLDGLGDKNEAILSPKEISDLMDPDIFFPNDTPKKRAAHVSRAIRKLNLSSEKLTRSNEGVRYRFIRQQVEKIRSSYFKSESNPTPSYTGKEFGLPIEDSQVKELGVGLP